MGWERLWAPVVVLLAGLAYASPAQADEEAGYLLPWTEVAAEVWSDGSVRVTQDVTFAFLDQEGRGAYLDVPRPAMATLTDITVSEDGRPYQKGPDAEIGVERPPGTFGEKTCSANGAHRIAWYFAAEPGTTRTFRIRYTMRRAVTAYDEHAFLQLPVWGRNWSQPLERLDVTVRLPRAGQGNEVYLAKSDPEGVLRLAPETTPQLTRAYAEDVRGGRAVTLHVAFPAAQLQEDPPNVRVMQGDGADRLESLRKGGFEREPYRGADCPVTAAAEGSGGGVGLYVGLGVLGVLAVTGVVALVRTFVTREHSGPDRRRGSAATSSGYSGGSSIGYYDGGSSGGGGDSGGGGGTW
ncbi:hypothetical protein GCM10010106_18080 [Thermopolyspora flexuosa]|jgi:uncharacterized membrane protein YgcG|uniref:Putative membrane protein DUF2207 n=1 Tax=Thermopolyspora flexuosa TaxID=103836 RepID=A0A543J448_9ACTN|nr:DUF2207 domain-containing protein [Thermopolyspora flexuosa]TQM77606.1 putative membrane protein DUF2207 [Thermopolyspora flexuosa]GGM72132.1 hypothetical protein GCM10010106_18080 [Thermopolyspora flexuosa]